MEGFGTNKKVGWGIGVVVVVLVGVKIVKWLRGDRIGLMGLIGFHHHRHRWIELEFGFGFGGGDRHGP